MVEYDGGCEVSVPSSSVVRIHLHWGLSWTPADKSVNHKSVHVAKRTGWPKYRCISPAVPLKLRHDSISTTAIAKKSRNLVLVMECQITLVGGRRARAAFQFTPPFGRSMVGVKPAKLALNAGSVSR